MLPSQVGSAPSGNGSASGRGTTGHGAVGSGVRPVLVRAGQALQGVGECAAGRQGERDAIGMLGAHGPGGSRGVRPGNGTGVTSLQSAVQASMVGLNAGVVMPHGARFDPDRESAPLCSGSDNDSDSAEDDDPVGSLGDSRRGVKRERGEMEAAVTGQEVGVAPGGYGMVPGGVAGAKPGKKTRGRVKIKMEFIDNKLRRYTTFSKRKTGIMKKVSPSVALLHMMFIGWNLYYLCYSDTCCVILLCCCDHLLMTCCEWRLHWPAVPLNSFHTTDQQVWHSLSGCEEVRAFMTGHVLFIDLSKWQFYLWPCPPPALPHTWPDTHTHTHTDFQINGHTPFMHTYPYTFIRCCLELFAADGNHQCTGCFLLVAGGSHVVMSSSSSRACRCQQLTEPQGGSQRTVRDHWNRSEVHALWYKRHEACLGFSFVAHLDLASIALCLIEHQSLLLWKSQPGHMFAAVINCCSVAFGIKASAADYLEMKSTVDQMHGSCFAVDAAIFHCDFR